MIRNVKGGSTYVQTCKAVSATGEGIAKLEKELTLTMDTISQSLEFWNSSTVENILRQLESKFRSTSSRPPHKKHKLSPITENNSPAIIGIAVLPTSPSQVLSQDELDRVYNLRVRDLHKELRREDADFKLKWNKKQLQDFYLSILVEKYQRERTQPKVENEITDVEQIPIASQNGNEIKNDAGDGEVSMSDAKLDSNVDDTNLSSVVHDVPMKPTEIRRDSMPMDIGEQQKELNGSSESRMSIEFTDRQGPEVFPSNNDEIRNKNIEVKENDYQSLDDEVHNNNCSKEPKIQIPEVKKGIVANVKAAYMEAVVSKNADFVPFRSPAPGSSKKLEKQYRSPLKTLAESGMQSVKRILSPAAKLKLPALQGKKVSDVGDSIQCCDDESNRSSQTAIEDPVQLTISEDSNENTNRDESTLSSSLRNVATGLHSQNECTSSLKSSVKASQEARKAKIAEMRSKSKNVASSCTKPNPTAADVSAKFASSSKVVASSHGQELEELKKQKIAAEMRAKHLGLTQASTNFKQTGQTLQKIPSNRIIPTAIVRPGMVASTSLTGKNKASIVPESLPEDNYVISDKEDDDDDDDSDCDSCDSGKPKKRIPVWAQKERLLFALEKQFSPTDDSYIDPDELFGEVESCDLKQIFGSPRKAKFQKRTSSGNWTNDRATISEKLAYKREHKLRLAKQQ